MLGGVWWAIGAGIYLLLLAVALPLAGFKRPPKG